MPPQNLIFIFLGVDAPILCILAGCICWYCGVLACEVGILYHNCTWVVTENFRWLTMYLDQTLNMAFGSISALSVLPFYASYLNMHGIHLFPDDTSCVPLWVVFFVQVTSYKDLYATVNRFSKKLIVFASLLCVDALSMHLWPCISSSSKALYCASFFHSIHMDAFIYLWNFSFYHWRVVVRWKSPKTWDCQGCPKSKRFHFQWWGFSIFLPNLLFFHLERSSLKSPTTLWS